MRLAVDREGNRIQDTAINRLTVIANESYEDFARQLQNEIEQDCGVDFANKIKDKRRREEVRYRKGFELDDTFKALWDKIKYQTSYRVEYSTAELIEKAAKAVKDMDDIKNPPRSAVEKAKIDVTEKSRNHSRVGGESGFEREGWRWSCAGYSFLCSETRKERDSRATLFIKFCCTPAGLPMR